jgi:hypothetical protein
VITLAVDDGLLELLLTFEAGSEYLEDSGEGEPDDDAEEDGRVLMFQTLTGPGLTKRRSLNHRQRGLNPCSTVRHPHLSCPTRSNEILYPSALPGNQ